MWPTEPSALLFGWITIDVVYMSMGRNGKKYLIVARCYSSQWPEAKALAKCDSESVMKFLIEDVFSRWGLPLRMSVDGGPENKGLVRDLQKQWGIHRVVASAYHPQGMGLIERGHFVLVSALRKMVGNWVDNLANALWADRTTVKRSTNETPAYLVAGREHILPIELSIPTWQTLPWSEVTDTPSLIAMRAKQFERRDERFREAIDRTVRLRHENKEYFDNSRTIRTTKLEPGDLVLLKDSFHENDRSRLTKFLPKWRGPFRIKESHEKGWYNLEELDGTPFRSHTPGNRLKRFYQRSPGELREMDQIWAGQEEGQPTDHRSDADSTSTHNSAHNNQDINPYGQDIPMPAAERSSEPPQRYELRKQRKPDATTPAEEHDPSEQSDIRRARDKTRRMIAVEIPRRNINRDEYQQYL
jgi:hypothetical protein